MKTIAIKSVLFLLVFFCSVQLQAQDLRLGLPYGHFTDVNTLEFSPDGKYLLSAADGGSMNVWDVEKKIQIYHYSPEGFKDSYDPISEFSADGNYLLVLTAKGSVKVIDLHLGAVAKEFFFEAVNGEGKVRFAKFHPDSKKILLVAEQYGQGAKVVDIETEEQVFRISGRFSRGAGFNAEANSVIFWNFDNAFVYDLNTQGLLHSFPVLFSSKLSPDGEYLLSYSYRGGKMRCFNTVTGQQQFSKMLQLRDIHGATISEDSRVFAVMSYGKQVKVYDLRSGKKVLKRWLSSPESKVSPQSNFLASADYGGDLWLYDLNDKNNKLKMSSGLSGLVKQIAFTTDETMVAWADSDGALVIYDLERMERHAVLRSSLGEVLDLEYSSQSQKVALLASNGSLNVLDLATGSIVYQDSLFIDLYSDENVLCFDAAGEKLVVRNSYDQVQVVDLLQMTSRTVLVYDSRIATGDTSVLVITEESVGKLDLQDLTVVDDVETGYWLANNRPWHQHFMLSNGLYVSASNNYKGKMEVIDLLTEEKYRMDHPIYEWAGIQILDVSHDGERILVPAEEYKIGINDEGPIMEIELRTGKVISLFQVSGKLLNQASYLEDSIDHVIAGGLDNDLYIFDRSKQLDEYSWYFNWSLDELMEDSTINVYLSNEHIPLRVSEVGHLTANSNFVILSSNHAFMTVVNRKSGVHYDHCIFGSGDWLQFTEKGLFDASQGAMEQMYWLKGAEVVGFEQLKEEFWVPGLAERIMDGEYLSSYQSIQNIQLPPETRIDSVVNNKVYVYLKKDKGGYGNVALNINGKEVSTDIRPSDFDTTLTEQVIVYDISHIKQLIDSNEIVVKANSRGQLVQGRGSKIRYVKKEVTPLKVPNFYGVVLGVGSYQNKDMDLKYSVPDANAIALSVQLGAEELFGKSRTHVYSINSSTEIKPTKENIKAVFDEVAQQANPEDIIFIYMSGHGVNAGGDQGDFYYLTSDAVSSEARDYAKDVTAGHAISTREFTEWLNEIAALKQVMVIDACGSGKAVENLSEERSLDRSQIKAIDRMKDRTGMFVISGCASDAVSYEASKFGQGLLTYAILQAMKGAALKENKYVDVNTILQFAKDEVPELAKDIHGVQEPQLLIPSSGSFTMGIMSDESKSKVPLKEPKLVFVRSMFIDGEEYYDVLGLSDSLDQALSSVSSRGDDGSFVFFDAKSYDGGHRVSGSYVVNQGQIILQLRVKGPEMELSKELIAGNKEEMIAMILKEINWE